MQRLTHDAVQAILSVEELIRSVGTEDMVSDFEDERKEERKNPEKDDSIFGLRSEERQSHNYDKKPLLYRTTAR